MGAARKQVVVTCLITACLLIAAGITVYLYSNRSREKSLFQTPSVQSVTVYWDTTKYPAKLYIRKHLIEVDAKYNVIPPLSKDCQGVAVKAFQQYPTTTRCKVVYAFIAFQEYGGTMEFQRTKKGVKLISSVGY